MCIIHKPCAHTHTHTIAIPLPKDCYRSPGLGAVPVWRHGLNDIGIPFIKIKQSFYAWKFVCYIETEPWSWRRSRVPPLSCSHPRGLLASGVCLRVPACGLPSRRPNAEDTLVRRWRPLAISRSSLMKTCSGHITTEHIGEIGRRDCFSIKMITLRVGIVIVMGRPILVKKVFILKWI